MNTAPTALYQNAPSSSSRTVYSADDMENATLLQKNFDASSSSKKNSSMSLKNVAYGLGIVALACSGSFVAGRSAARYKLSSSGSGGSSTQLGAVARLGSSSSATSKKHSTAHLAAGKKAAKKAASSSSEEEEEEDAPVADPESMTKEEMAEEIKQLRGYMTSLVDEDEVRILR
jgi:hypothetical protein